MFSSKILLNYLLFIIFIILLIIITEILTNYNNFKLISKKIFKQWIIISTQKRLISSLIFCYYYFEQNRSKQCQIWKISLCQLLNLINVYMYCYLFEESKKMIWRRRHRNTNICNESVSSMFPQRNIKTSSFSCISNIYSLVSFRKVSRGIDSFYSTRCRENICRLFPLEFLRI